MKLDPYIQDAKDINGNDVLLNKLNITNYDELRDAEKDITFTKFLNIDSAFKQEFDVQYIKDIHKHIFNDIFDWAGEFRTVLIKKEEIVIPKLSLNYTEYRNIEKELEVCLENFNSTNWDTLALSEKVAKFTSLLTELWKIHPFRDGNTRVTLTFANLFAREHDFPMDLGFLLDNLTRKYDENDKITQFSIRDKFVLSALPKEHYPEPEYLQSLIHKSIISGVNKQIETLQKTFDEER